MTRLVGRGLVIGTFKAAALAVVEVIRVGLDILDGAGRVRLVVAGSLVEVAAV